jgi:N-acetylneuraminic acid mutarotase
MVALNGKLYLIGGRNATSTVIYDLVYEYDPVADMLTQKASLPSPRFSGTAVTDGTEIYYLGGSSTTNIFASGINTICIYNPATNAWRQSNSTLPTTRTRHSAVYANGQLWVFSGVDNSGNLITDIWSNNYVGYAIRWSTGDTTRSITVSPISSTTYWGELYNNTNSCRDSVTITVEYR